MSMAGWRWGRWRMDVAATVLGIVTLAGCGGGGGGGGSNPTPRPTATTAPIQTSTPMPTPTTPPLTAAPTDTAAPTATDTPPIATSTPAPSDTPEPTNTQPPPSPIGPVVTAFGIADGAGTFNQALSEPDAEGRTVYPRVGGDGFVIYVEGRPGTSRLPVATNLLSAQGGNPMGQPDLQLVASQDFGNGSAAVCDKSYPNPGGVPKVDPPRFDFVQAVSDALNDAGCRFRSYAEADFACTQDSSGTYQFANGGSAIQFCALVNDAMTLPEGDTVLSVRLRDTAGNPGAVSQIVVRVR